MSALAPVNLSGLPNDIAVAIGKIAAMPTFSGWRKITKSGKGRGFTLEFELAVELPIGDVVAGRSA